MRKICISKPSKGFNYQDITIGKIYNVMDEDELSVLVVDDKEQKLLYPTSCFNKIDRTTKGACEEEPQISVQETAELLIEEFKGTNDFPPNSFQELNAFEVFLCGMVKGMSEVIMDFEEVITDLTGYDFEIEEE